uniref:Uncharacterized protein n=1 Tax=Globodera rostochiensis TaxID=31243 RepID=A0A914HFI7_GLORO
MNGNQQDKMPKRNERMPKLNCVAWDTKLKAKAAALNTANGPPKPTKDKLPTMPMTTVPNPQACAMPSLTGQPELLDTLVKFHPQNAIPIPARIRR